MSEESLDLLRIELILNTKRAKRNLDLLEVASKMRVYVDSVGSIKTAASDLKLSPRMVNLFLTVLELPPRIKSLIKERKIESLDFAYRLSLLEKSEDQKYLTDKYIEGDIKTKDIREIVTIKRKNPELEIGEILSEYKKHQDIKKYKYVFPRVLLHSGEDPVRPENTRAIVKDRFEKALGGDSVESVEVGDSVIAIVLTESGYRILTQRAKNIGLSKKDAITGIIIRKG